MSSPMSPRASPAPGASGPVADQPTDRERVPPPGRKFPCAACGARIEFDPASHALKCPYCGHSEKIEPTAKEVRERDWDGYWRTCAGEEALLTGRSSQVTCSVCSAVVLVEDRVATDKCPYCGTFLENKPESAKAMIPPGGILAFAITDRQACDAFNRWIASRWFAPSQLYKCADLGRLSSVYVPFWTYDSMTYTHYSGERGDDYTETETYEEKDATGQTVTKTRQVTKTRWTHVSGDVRHFFDDLLICASRSVPEHLIRKLAPWDLPRLEDFRPDLLSGFQTERYAIGLREGFDKAKQIMEAEIRRLCERDIGGDHQRLHTVHTQHVGVSFKHILLPVWLAAYRYQNQTYQVLVNGRTGRVAGKRPYSWLKITLLVLAILAILALLLWLFSSRSQGTAPGNPRPSDGQRGALLRESESAESSRTRSEEGECSVPAILPLVGSRWREGASVLKQTQLTRCAQASIDHDRWH